MILCADGTFKFSSKETLLFEKMERDFEQHFKKNWIQMNSKLVGVIFTIMSRGLQPTETIAEVEFPSVKPTGI